MASIHQQRALEVRRRIEEEWQDFVEAMPDGIEKTVLQEHGIPKSDRLELYGGVAPSDTFVSRIRKHEAAEMKDRNVHHRLRSTAQEIAREFKERVEASSAVSLKVATKKAVQYARDKMRESLQKFNAIDQSLKNIAANIADGMPREDVREVREDCERQFAHDRAKTRNMLVL